MNVQEKVPEIEPKVETKVEPEMMKTEPDQTKSNEINSNSCNNTVIEHLEDSMSAVDISSESFSSCTSSTTPRVNKIQTAEKTEKVKSKKQTNIQNFFAKKPKNT